VTHSKAPSFLVNNKAVILWLKDYISTCTEELKPRTFWIRIGDEHSKLTINDKYLNIPRTGKNQYTNPCDISHAQICKIFPSTLMVQRGQIKLTELKSSFH
jgi:hypothetical protein